MSLYLVGERGDGKWIVGDTNDPNVAIPFDSKAQALDKVRNPGTSSGEIRKRDSHWYTRKYGRKGRG